MWRVKLFYVDSMNAVATIKAFFKKENSSDTILLWIIRLGIFAVLFVPLLYHSKTFFPFIVMKNVSFRVLVEIIVACWILLALKDRRFRPGTHPVSITIAIFFAVTLLASLVGVNVDRSIWGDYERMGGLFGMIHLFGFFLVLVSVFKNEHEWHSFFTFSVFTSIVMSFFALAQRFGAPFLIQSYGGERLTGTIGNPIYLAAYLLFHIFFLIYFLYRNKDFDYKLFAVSVIAGDVFIVVRDVYFSILLRTGALESQEPLPANIITGLFESWHLLFALVLFHGLVFGTYILRTWRAARVAMVTTLLIFEVFVLFWTQTRGALIGLLLGVLCIGFFGIAAKRKTHLARWYLGGAVSLAVLMAVVYVFRESSFVKNIPMLDRLTSIEVSDITTQSRLLTWQATWRGWTENPVRFITGYGLENYYTVFDRHFPVQIYRDSGSQIWFDRAHNVILDTGVTTGIIGLLAYMGIFYFAFQSLYFWHRKENDFSFSVVFSAMLIAYAVQNFFVFDTIDSYMLFFLVLGFIVLKTEPLEVREKWMNAIQKRLAPMSRAREARLGTQAYAVTAALLILLVSIFSIRLFLANRYLYEAIRGSFANPFFYRENVAAYQNAIDSSVTGRMEARQQLAQYAVNLGTQNQRSVLAGDMSYVASAAIDQMAKSVAEEPLNVRHYLLLTSLYNRFYSLDASYLDSGIALMQKAQALSPTRPHIFIELGYAYLSKNDIARGISYLLEAVKLSPHTKEVRMIFLLNLIRFQQYELADREAEYIMNTFQKTFGIEDLDAIVGAYESRGRYDTIITLYHRYLQREENALREIIENNTADLDIRNHASAMGKQYARLALMYAYSGNTDLAEKSIQRAVWLDATHAQEAERFLQELHAGKITKPQ